MLAGHPGPTGRPGHPPGDRHRPDSALLVAPRLRYPGRPARVAQTLLPAAGNHLPPVPPAAVAGSQGNDRQRLLLYPDRLRTQPRLGAQRSLPVRRTRAGQHSGILQGGEGPGRQSAFKPRKPAPRLRRPGHAGRSAGRPRSLPHRAPVPVPLRGNRQRQNQHRGTHPAHLSRLRGDALRGGGGRPHHHPVRPGSAPPDPVPRRSARSALGSVRAPLHHGGRRTLPRDAGTAARRILPGLHLPAAR